MIDSNEKSNAFLLHLSSFSGYFFPLGSIIVPLVIWEVKKKESEFIDATGKEVVNFNLSYLLYFTVLIIGIVTFAISLFTGDIREIPLFFIISMGFGIAVLAIVRFVLIILGAVKANQGELYRYPLTINFLK